MVVLGVGVVGSPSAATAASARLAWLEKARAPKLLLLLLLLLLLP